MASGIRRVSVIVIAGFVIAACSSSTGGSSSGPTSGPTSGSTAASATSPAAVDPSDAAVQSYVDQVNALCDALLPRVLKVIKGGHPGVYPVKEFFAELPAHQALRDGFDRQLAKVAVPPAAHSQAAALQAYIRFANRLDAQRLAAARQGQAAFDQETRGEQGALDDPTIQARTAAGFNDSCNAR